MVNADLKREEAKLPVQDNDINAYSVGCYTSQIRLKQKHRKQVKRNGRSLPTQVEQEDSHLTLDWRKKVSFGTRVR